MVTVEEVRLDGIPLQQNRSPDSASVAANATREENKSVVLEKPSNDVYNWQKYGQKNINSAANASGEKNISVVPEKPFNDVYTWQKYGQKNVNSAANASGKESISVVLEKPSDDGFNWRKYGQKNIKGNRHTRSYYKCSHQNCLVKKQIERAPDGRIIDTCYFGKHDHPKPQTGTGTALPSILSMKVQIGDDPSSVVAEDKSSSAHSLTADDAALKETNENTSVPMSAEGTNEHTPVPMSAEHTPSTVTKDYGNTVDNVASKRRKTGDDYDMSIDNKSRSKSRWVVETVSAVDIVNDGYRWRKYGQKLVKDNPNARSYYRCTNPGCLAKKRVERASHDPNVVITTYESHHDHNIPLGRTLFPHNGSPAASIASGHNGVKPKDVILTQGTAAVCKEQGNTTNQADAPEEVNRAQNSAEKQVSSDNTAKKDNPPNVNQDQSSTIIKQEGSTIDHPAKKDGPADEVKQAQSSVAICRQKQVDTIDLPAKKDDTPEKVKQAQSSVAICRQEQVDTIDLPAKKDDTLEEVKKAQKSAAVCEQEKGSTIDHPAEKKDPPEESDQAQGSVTVVKQEQGSTTDHPAEKTTQQMI